MYSLADLSLSAQSTSEVRRGSARTHVFQPDYSVQPVPPGETMTHVIIKPGQPSPELHILGLVNIEN